MEKLIIEYGQIVYPEEPFRPENHKLCSLAIISFREWRYDFEKSNEDIEWSDLPEDYIDLISILAHESDETINKLSKRLNDLLSPFEKKQSMSVSFISIIKQVISTYTFLERYGLADSVLSLEGSPSSIPKGFSLFRWQIYDTTKLPTDILDNAIKRRNKRKSFSRLFTSVFRNLTTNQRKELLSNQNETFILDTKTNKKDKLLFENDFFSSIKENEYIHIAPYTNQNSRKLCSSFDTLFFVGLNDSFDLKNKFKSSIRKRSDIVKPNQLKLLQFHENVRPAYYGTWSKKSSAVTGRRPFAKDEDLNYDEDSEAEWDHDVDSDDIYTLGSDEEYEEYEDDIKPTFLVPEDYLSEDEGTHPKKKKKKNRVVSRPAKWPISSNKFFPMKPLIIGPSFESAHEPENHPLSDFKTSFLFEHTQMNPFREEEIEQVKITNSIYIETNNKIKPPFYQREVDKMMDSNKNELIKTILENKSKTMMGLVSVLKSKKNFNKYTVAQLQAMIHDIAFQELENSNKEYNWYIYN